MSNRAKEIEEFLKMETVRTFDSGATRSPLGEKLEYHRFLDSRVLKRWCEYLQKHRVQSDGNLREPDNWKKGITMEAYISSMMRHMMDIWLWHDGYDSEMNEKLDDSLCAILFNAHGLLYELLAERKEQ